MELHTLESRLQALAVFRSLLSDPVVEALLACLAHNIDGANWDALGAYGRIYRPARTGGGGNLAGYIRRLVEEDDNVCIRAVGRGETPPAYLMDSVAEELKTLQMAADLTPEALTLPLLRTYQSYLPRFGTSEIDLAALYRQRLENVGRCGWGVYASHHMFCLDGEGRIVPVGHPDAICLEDLVGYERERGLVLDNLRALLEGRSAANMLLTGDAGTGKSSTVKAAGNALKGGGPADRRGPQGSAGAHPRPAGRAQRKSAEIHSLHRRPVLPEG